MQTKQTVFGSTKLTVFGSTKQTMLVLMDRPSTDLSGNTGAFFRFFITVQHKERIFIGLMTSDRKLEASREGSK